MHQRMRLAEPGDERQDDMDRSFVGADQDAATPQVPEVLDGNLRLLGKAEQSLGEVAQEPSGVGQGGILGRPVEQPLADTLLQPPHRLADGRLRPVQLHGGAGEAPLGRNLKEYAQFAQFHGTTLS
jgi:hypothetical protein